VYYSTTFGVVIVLVVLVVVVVVMMINFVIYCNIVYRV
jgi:hypothetical protein